jgi:hypothetical protein
VGPIPSVASPTRGGRWPPGERCRAKTCLPVSRTRNVAVDRGKVTKGYAQEQVAVPIYVQLYRPAFGLPRRAVGRRYEMEVGDELVALAAVSAWTPSTGAAMLRSRGG